VPDADALLATLDPAFRARASSYSARQVAGYALLASGAAATGFDDLDVAGPDRNARPARAAVQATEHLAVEHAGARSVWLQNSVRGAVGLAVAVFVAQRAGLQHAFWVVLGTLSVLRSNALSTGWSILSALAGTAAGIVVGAALVIAIGTHEPVLWGVLPVAIMLAAYAPRAISFAAGQAGFTVVLFVLFNLIQPTGWKVGLVRIEDVAIGFGVSLGPACSSGRVEPATSCGRIWLPRTLAVRISSSPRLTSSSSGGTVRGPTIRRTSQPSPSTGSTTRSVSTSPNGPHGTRTSRASEHW